jgi:gamma-glutamylcyclotransferase (GGCT)/AIG2-like uncharacterized protein YtfP
MLIFVYGTLRRGEHNHVQLGPARFVGEAWTTPHYELVDMGDYPALLETGADAVRGELYDVPESWLSHLDAFEDVPTLYERKLITLNQAQALGYVMRREVAGAAPRIPSGDWCAWHKLKTASTDRARPQPARSHAD